MVRKEMRFSFTIAHKKDASQAHLNEQRTYEVDRQPDLHPWCTGCLTLNLQAKSQSPGPGSADMRGAVGQASTNERMTDTTMRTRARDRAQF